MKRILPALLPAVAMLCGCIQNEFDTSRILNSVTATVEQADTRAGLAQEDGGTFRMHWEEKDVISILSGNANIPFTLTSGAGTGRATFYNEGGVPAGECFAVYPFDAATELDGGTVYLTYPAELNYDTEGKRVKGGEFMIATSGDGSFSFLNIHSYLSMTFSSTKEDEITSIVIEAADGKPVSGTAQVKFTDGTPQVTMTGDGKAVTVDMAGVAVGPGNPLSISVPLAPVFNDGIKVTVNCRNGGARILKAPAKIGRNQIVEMNEAPLVKPAVVKVNTTGYTSLDEALTDGVAKFRTPVITLLSDIDYDGVLTLSGSKVLKLDLAGHRLTTGMLVSDADEVILTDSSKDADGSLESTTDKALKVSAGTFTFEAGVIRSKDSTAVYVQGDANNAPHFIFNGGTITSTKAPSLLFVGNNGTADMHGGSILAKTGFGIHARASKDGLYARVNVDGGSITGSATHLFYAYTRSKIKISDGFFQTDKGRVCHNGTSNVEVCFCISGGYFHATNYTSGKYLGGYNATSVNNIFIRGGYFNVDPIAESKLACSGQPLRLQGPQTVEKLSKHVNSNGYTFSYQVVDKYDGIRIGYSRNGTSDVTKDAFTKAFNDAGAAIDFFEDYVRNDDEALAMMSRVDALAIPGSASADPSVRNASEQRLIRAAISQGKPVLGVCYGHQRICLVKGGKVPSVASTYPKSTITHKEVVDGVNSVRLRELHSINIDKSSILYSLLGEETIMVNSSHNYCCTISNGKLKISATAPDGCCEALESTTAGEYLLGVQFHPEYLYSSMGRSKFLAIFRYIVDTARTQKESRVK